MKKSVYSLVLSDAVVDAVDRAAYKIGVSRSNYINSILAEHLSYTTPQKRIRSVFDVLEDVVKEVEEFRIMQQPSESMFSLLSSLKYKYRPTIRYSVELYGTLENDAIGEIKVIFRTQSSEFLVLMKEFFVSWAKAEQKYISKCLPASVKYILNDGKFQRSINISNRQTDERELGKAISSYIQMFDRVLKEYVSVLPDSAEFNRIVDREYMRYLKSNSVVI